MPCHPHRDWDCSARARRQWSPASSMAAQPGIRAGSRCQTQSSPQSMACPPGLQKHDFLISCNNDRLSPPELSTSSSYWQAFVCVPQPETIVAKATSQLHAVLSMALSACMIIYTPNLSQKKHVHTESFQSSQSPCQSVCGYGNTWCTIIGSCQLGHARSITEPDAAAPVMSARILSGRSPSWRSRMAAAACSGRPCAPCSARSSCASRRIFLRVSPAASAALAAYTLPRAQRHGKQ